MDTVLVDKDRLLDHKEPLIITEDSIKIFCLGLNDTAKEA